MPDVFGTTWLEEVEKYGISQMGSGPFGSSEWTETAEAAALFVTTWLEMTILYGVNSMGSGPFGDTIWNQGGL